MAMRPANESFRAVLSGLIGLVMAVAPLLTAQAAWAPTRQVELIVPAGPGGGADKMARLIQKIVSDRKLMPQALVVINKSGNQGAEGFLDIKKSRANPHKLIVTLSNLFTTPLVTGADFNWRDMTPVSMLALDQFILWVHADSPYRTVSDYIKAVKAAPGKFKMGGTGSKQEDEIITRALQQEAKIKFTYVAYKGGGEVAKALVAKEIDSTVNNPAEAMEQWRAGKVRPLAVFDYQRLPQKEKVTASASWNDVPTMKEQGYSVEYLMLRGIFAAPGIQEEAQDYYIQLLQAVTRTPEWQEYLRQGALKNRFMTKEIFNSWLEFSEIIHKTLLQAQAP